MPRVNYVKKCRKDRGRCGRSPDNDEPDSDSEEDKESWLDAMRESAGEIVDECPV